MKEKKNNPFGKKDQKFTSRRVCTKSVHLVERKKCLQKGKCALQAWAAIEWWNSRRTLQVESLVWIADSQWTLWAEELQWVELWPLPSILCCGLLPERKAIFPHVRCCTHSTLHCFLSFCLISGRQNRLRLRAFESALTNLVDQIMRSLAIHSATNALASAENFFHGAWKFFRQRSRSHRTSNAVDVVERQVALVFDVLVDFSVARWFFQRFDDQTGGRWNDLDFAISVRNRNLACHLQALPVLRRFLHIITDFLWRHAQRTKLWSERRHGRRFTTDRSDHHNCNFIWFRRHC